MDGLSYHNIISFKKAQVKQFSWVQFKNYYLLGGSLTTKITINYLLFSFIRTLFIKYFLSGIEKKYSPEIILGIKYP